MLFLPRSLSSQFRDPPPSKRSSAFPRRQLEPFGKTFFIHSLPTETCIVLFLPNPPSSITSRYAPSWPSLPHETAFFDHFTTSVSSQEIPYSTPDESRTPNWPLIAIRAIANALFSPQPIRYPPLKSPGCLLCERFTFTQNHKDFSQPHQ